MFGKSAILRVLALGLGLMGAGLAYQYFSGPALVCKAAGDAASLPVDLQYTGGFIQGRRQTVFTQYELGIRAPLAPASQAYLTRIHAALQAKGTELVFLLVPPRAVVLSEFTGHDVAALETNYRDRLGQLRTTGMLVPDALGLLQAQSNPLDVFYARDTHWTPAGAKLVAQAIASDVRKLPVYNSLTPQAFTTHERAVDEHKGNYSFPLNTICQSKIIPEALPRYETTPSAPSAGLLDDAMPPITLVGTSFSNRSGHDLFNFAGSLRQALGQDVLNQAVDGGGYDTAILNYLDSAVFLQQPPKLLIWEAISEQEQNQPVMYRQVLATIAGSCTPLYSESANLQSGGVLLNLPPNVVTAGSKNYISLSFSDLSVLSFALTLEYADGQKETVAINRSNRVPNNGRYFLELSDAYQAPLVRVRADAGVGTAISAVCAYQ